MSSKRDLFTTLWFQLHWTSRISIYLSEIGYRKIFFCFCSCGFCYLSLFCFVFSFRAGAEFCTIAIELHVEIFRPMIQLAIVSGNHRWKARENKTGGQTGVRLSARENSFVNCLNVFKQKLNDQTIPVNAPVMSYDVVTFNLDPSANHRHTVLFLCFLIWDLLPWRRSNGFPLKLNSISTTSSYF